MASSFQFHIVGDAFDFVLVPDATSERIINGLAVARTVSL